MQLLRSPKFPYYNSAYYKVLPYIVELRAKGADKEEPELETCFEALYGILLLKLQKKEISEETRKAQEAISTLLAMLSYTRRETFDGDVRAYEKEAWKKAQVLPGVEDTCMSVQFSHIMAGGYSAGYYSYKWAEVLDADAFSLFKEKGIFNQEVAASFRENILSKGGTEHPMTLYKRFRGQEPSIHALLKRNGIIN